MEKVDATMAYKTLDTLALNLLLIVYRRALVRERLRVKLYYIKLLSSFARDACVLVIRDLVLMTVPK